MIENQYRYYKVPVSAHEYVLSYRYTDGLYGFTIKAASWEDAQERLRAIRMTATLDGQLVDTYKANMFTMVYTHLYCFIMNIISGVGGWIKRG